MTIVTTTAENAEMLSNAWPGEVLVSVPAHLIPIVKDILGELSAIRCSSYNCNKTATTVLEDFAFESKE